MIKRWLTGLFGLVIVLLIVVVLIFGGQPQPQWVDTAEVSYASMRMSVEEKGKTSVIDRYTVLAPVPGTACRTDVNVGDYVAKNQSLASIEPARAKALDPRSWAEARSRVSATESALRAAEQTAQSALAKMQVANKELTRLNALAKKDQSTQNSLSQAATLARRAKVAKRSADFAVNVANHELEAARTALKYVGSKGDSNAATTVQIYAPVQGRVLQVHHVCKGVIAAGQPLFEIGDTQSLEIKTDVLSSDAVKIKPGMRVRYNCWGGETALEGQVRIVEPVGVTKISALGVEEQRVQVISDLSSDITELQNLGDSYGVESEFILWEEDHILQVPASALFRFNSGWAVFTLTNEKAKKQEVKAGVRNGRSVQILEGLEEGENVIIHPDDKIADGMKVRLR